MPKKSSSSGSPGTPLSRYKHWKKRRPRSVGILFEGDSWLAFPMLLRTNIVKELKRTYDDKIVQLNLSHIGDDAREMLCGDQYAKLFKVMSSKSVHIDAIIFSGGGNDIVATNFPVLLNTYQPGMTWDKCINMARFQRRLQEIEFAYQDLADLRDDYQSDATIFSHSYDYAIPSGKGVRILGLKVASGWLKKVMDGKNIPATHQQSIIDYMLSRLDDIMIRLEQERKNWKHVQTQGTLKDGDWGDELHPTKEGFRKIAAKFENALESVFPQALS